MRVSGAAGATVVGIEQKLDDDFAKTFGFEGFDALREVMVQVPNVGWDDVGGLDDAQIRLVAQAVGGAQLPALDIRPRRP